MISHTSNRKITYPNLKINNINIERVTQFNFLGVMFNSHMDWSRHINYISMKISSSTGILYRLKDIYPQSVLLTLYNQGVCLTVARGECISSRASGTPVTTSPAGE